ncbi:MAG: 3-dehydroquinate synthase [Acidobacteriota bacterium]
MKQLDRVFLFGDCPIYQIHYQEKLPLLAKSKDYVFITDRNVFSLVKGLVPQKRTVILEPGEKRKTLSCTKKIYQKLIQLGVDRSWTAVGLGGGVVGDLTGFVASTYMRGIDFILVPTTLLSQTDASIGGKNGVNFSRYKNIIGTFAKPKSILLDFSFLQTLPQEEILCGAAEIIKHALIASQSLFHDIEKMWRRIMGLDKEALNKIVLESIRIKSSIVKKDANEKNERRKLNFGHTLGHALEMTKGLSHGRAVGAGMEFATRISVKEGILTQKESSRIINLLQKTNLVSPLSLSRRSVLKTIRNDKKKEKDDLHFVFLNSIGKAEVRKISFTQLNKYIYDLCKS